VHGAALDYTSKSSLSALMLAVVNGHRDTARLLIAAGADVTLRGSGSPGFAGKTARDLARARGDDELERFLEGDHTV
jgi:ankyrin repeat protein